PYTGRRGPTEGGLLHAPSDAQARAAIILRDKAINDPEAGRGKMDFDSTAVRLAKQFADEVRAGSHIQEVLGRAVERAVADRETIKRLRDKYRIREEHAGRRTCDGQRVLAASEAELGLNDEQLRRLKPLRRIVDAYADLLVAEGVFDVVAGRPEAAGAAMDAASGLALPPELELLRTPRQGRSVNTVVLLALRDDEPGPATTDVGVSPGELADPAVAKWLADEALANGPWAYQATRNGVAVPAVTIEQMGLSPVDTLALTEDALALLAVRVAREDHSDHDEQADWKLDRDASTTKDALARHERVRRLAYLLSGRPVQPRDVVGVEGTLGDPAVITELRERLKRLTDAATTLSEALENAADDAARRAAVYAAVRWGIMPTLGDEADVTDTTYRERVKQLLDARLAGVPDEQDAPTARGLAEAISALASAGKTPVLSRMSRTALKDLLAGSESLAVEPTLDRDWLEVVAAVRGPLARVESHQIEAARDGRPPLRAWTNRPGDPWQSSVARTRKGFPEPSTLIAVYEAQAAMDGDAVDGDTVALMLLDSWSEVVPEDRHATTAAFGFNAPAARPPQAILIAVPPVEDQPLDPPTLAQIVLETRELAHARMARLEDVPELTGVLPMAMLPTAPRAGVDLGISEV
ncbi:MAG TPA: hypothetical protein VFR46_01505, partial [Actinomycetes bacterium]|nr:hypothetical protein [Actinomycetes bacterium]